MNEVAVEQRVDSVNESMSSRSFEPDVPAEVVPAGSDRDEAAACLEDDPGLLCIHVNRAEEADSSHQGFKELSKLCAFAFEVLFDSVVTAGVRHVAGDKSLIAFRAFPERPLLFF